VVEVTARQLRLPAARATIARALTYRSLLLGASACAVVGTLGFANGGYFPVTWGWSSLALLGLVVVALAFGVAIELGTLDLLFVGALALLAGWIALSLLWTGSIPSTVLENERVLVYLGGAGAAVLLIRRASASTLLTGLWAALGVVCTYGLATRLFPDRIGSFDAIAVYRLSKPVGYWNAFGILAALGTLLAIGLAARSGPAIRSLAGGSTVIMMLTLYFTYSRGAWGAFLFGAAIGVLVDRRRLQLVTTGLVLLPWSVIAVWVASTSPALTREGAGLGAAAHDGHGLAVIAIALVVAAALSMLVLDWLDQKLRVPDRVRRVYAGTLLFVLAAVLIVVFGRYGFPPTLARKAYDAFNEQPVTDADLNNRLFNLSSNGRIENWHTAWQQASDHPVLGSGAGTYAQFWFQHRRVDATVHDAHSLYLETLGELGPLGLALLVSVLAMPLVALRRARSAPLASAACGAYAAFLVHAAADWDWEMPAITLTAVFCGVALLAWARREGEPRAMRLPIRLGTLGGTLALTGFVVLGLIGNTLVSASSKSTNAGHLARAESQARRATHFAPWSSEPWRKLAEAQAISGNLAAARATFRKAIAKDDRDWTLWFELAETSKGAQRRAAFAEASRLNPLDTRLKPDQSESSG
jgi:hypothetical protein